MPRSKRSPIEQSYKLQMELIPLFASSIPAASRKQLARRPPKGPMLAAEIERHIEQLKAHADAKPIVYISSRKSGQILKTLGIQIQTKELPQFAKEINSAFLEYSLRLQAEQLPLSSWLPRFRAIVALLRKLKPLLPRPSAELQRRNFVQYH